MASQRINLQIFVNSFSDLEMERVTDRLNHYRKIIRAKDFTGEEAEALVPDCEPETLHHRTILITCSNVNRISRIALRNIPADMHG